MRVRNSPSRLARVERRDPGVTGAVHRRGRPLSHRRNDHGRRSRRRSSFSFSGRRRVRTRSHGFGRGELPLGKQVRQRGPREELEPDLRRDRHRVVLTASPRGPRAKGTETIPARWNPIGAAPAREPISSRRTVPTGEAGSVLGPIGILFRCCRGERCARAPGTDHRDETIPRRSTGTAMSICGYTSRVFVCRPECWCRPKVRPSR